MRVRFTPVVSGFGTNFIDCCMLRRRYAGTAEIRDRQKDFLARIHGVFAMCCFLAYQRSQPRSTREYAHCCRTASPYRSGHLFLTCCQTPVLSASRYMEEAQRSTVTPPQVGRFTPDSSATQPRRTCQPRSGCSSRGPRHRTRPHPLPHGRRLCQISRPALGEPAAAVTVCRTAITPTLSR